MRNNFSVRSSAQNLGSCTNAVRLNPEHEKEYDGYLVSFGEQVVSSSFYPIIFDSEVPVDEIHVPLNIRKEKQLSIGKAHTVTLLTKKNEGFQIAETFLFEIILLIGGFKGTHVDKGRLITAVFNMQDYPFIKGQELNIPYHDGTKTYIFTLKVLNSSEINSAETIFRLDKNTTKLDINLSPTLGAKNIRLVDEATSDLLPDLSKFGVGGHQREIEQILKQVIYPRLLPSKITEPYGLKPEKGFILEGPPGTGKTLILRAIKDYLGDKAVLKIINGPELINKYVGQSEENLRSLFADAQRDWKNLRQKSPLYLFLFDEIEVVFPKRKDREGGASVYNGMVNTILTLMDGVDSLENILVVGSTNRPDLIDNALLRRGRLGLQIKIDLPDLSERIQILNIYIKPLREKNLLDSDVNDNFLQSLADQTKGFSGADLEALVNDAKAQTVSELLTLSPSGDKMELKVPTKNTEGISQYNTVSRRHFDSVVERAKASKENKVLEVVSSFFIHEGIKEIIAEFEAKIKLLSQSKHLHQLNFIITGEKGVGKTALAKHLAQIASEFDIFLEMLTPKTRSNYHAIYSSVENSEFSLVVIDALERLLKMNPRENHLYDNSYRSDLQLLCRDTQTKRIVIVTTEDPNCVTNMELFSSPLNNFSLQGFKELNYTLITKLFTSHGYKYFSGGDYADKVIELDRSISMNALITKMEEYVHNQIEKESLDIQGFLNYILQDSSYINNKLDEANSTEGSLNQDSSFFKFK